MAKKKRRKDGRMDNRTEGRTFSYIDSRTDRHLVMQTIELQPTELKAVEMKKKEKITSTSYILATLNKQQLNFS